MAVIENIVMQAVLHCKANGLDNNPVEVLRYYQTQLFQGRPLEIEDPTSANDGLTNSIFVDRLHLLEAGFDEIKAFENKRITLEVQFYGEVMCNLNDNANKLSWKACVALYY